MPKINRYIIKDREQSTVAEEFRAIRNSILAAQAEDNVKSVLFVGASKGEGSAMTAVNTAAALAYAGKNVILVDLDLRNPVLQDVFPLKAIGVTNIIRDGKSLDEVLQISPIEKLQILTSGTPVRKPLDVLSHSELRNLLESIKTRADYILINTAPLLLSSKAIVTDACLLASKVDRVALVIDSQTVRIHRARKMLQLLLDAKAKIIGTVLNNVEEEEDVSRPYVPAS